jgi:twinkle protein
MDAEFVRHVPCEACGSSDANGLYDDGHTWCFSCGRYVPPEGNSTEHTKGDRRVSGEFLTGEVQALQARGLTEETCRKFGYRVAHEDGNAVQVADYRDAEGTLVAQKVRRKDKTFKVIGGGKDMPLFGANLWQAGGKRIVVTEGEIDAMSVSQAFGNRWPAVSLPNGAQSAKKAIQRSLEYLTSFDEVVLAFDMDEPGREATAECVPLFPPGKVRVANLPKKDANAMLQAGEIKELTTCIYQAALWRPDGIVNGADLWERITATQDPGIAYPWPKLTAKTYGQHRGTLTTWTAGSGVGKSTVVAQVAYELAFKHGLRIGYVALEENVGRAGQRFLSQHLGKLVHLPGQATTEELRAAFDATLGSGRVWLFDHFGSSDADNLLSKLRYLAVSCEVDAIILDHLSIAISGLDMDGDERRCIDFLMTNIRTLVEETGVIFHLISHLRRSHDDDKGAEEGGRVALSMLRGSHSIAQLSDMVIGIERDLQAEDRTMLVRVLKNRVSGDTGPAGHLEYDRSTGRVSEVEPKEQEDDGDDAADF